MIFRQFLHSDPVAASYIFGCGGQGVCHESVRLMLSDIPPPPPTAEIFRFMNLGVAPAAHGGR